MHPKLLQFLNGPSNTEGKTNLRLLAELIAVNGGSLDINRIGAVPNESKWGRAGLTPNEALELTGLIQFCWGIMFTLEQDLRPLLHEAVQNEITRQEKGSAIHIAGSSEIAKFGKPFIRTK